jgi:hypothetical protein
MSFSDDEVSMFTSQIKKQLDIKEPIRVWNLHDRAAGLFSLLYEDYNLSACEICDGDVILVEKYVFLFPVLFAVLR